MSMYVIFKLILILFSSFLCSVCDLKIAKKQSSMNHAEVVIARQAIEEGRGLVVIVNKMDLLRGRKNNSLLDKVLEIVPQEIQTVIPQVCFILKWIIHIVPHVFHFLFLVVGGEV
jgi:hypothetical protein